MRKARATLAIFAFAAVIGCTVQTPARATKVIPDKLPLPATEAAYPLTRDLTRRFARLYAEPGFDVDRQPHEMLMRRLNQDGLRYFVSSHIPAGEDLWAAPLAVDGIAIIVNPTLPLDELQIDQLRGLFAGAIANWSEVGGPAIEVAPISPPAGADSYLELERVLTGAGGISGKARLAPNFEAMLEMVAEEPGAIGYLPLSSVDNRVKALSVNGAQPSRDALSKQEYPLRSTIYIIGKREPPPAYANLIGWIQSDAGQAAVAEYLAPLP